MTFDEVLDQVRELLEREGRVSYRALKLRFNIDEEVVEGIKDELIHAKRVAVDEDGKVLVWTGVHSDGETTKRGKGETEQHPTSRPQTLDASRSDGERRQLTVQFIDLVGSTTLSQQLDPEDYHARVVAYQAACRQAIERYDGHIAQYLGDGVLVYFGYPAAHEEDAVRAVRSSLEIVAAVGQLEFTPPLQVRIGMHTGPVVVGKIGAGERTERLALGETPNIAARVQGHAAPNEVLVSSATLRLIHGLFDIEERGPQELKGISTPMLLYRIVQKSAAQSRFEVAVHKGLTPLVGRAEEFALLQRGWEHAKAGAGQVVLLSGEPGIGKSRLVQALKEQLGHEQVTRVEFRCSPYHQNSALYPIIDHLQRLLQFAREDAPAVKLEKLHHTLSHYRFPQADTVPLLAALLSLPHPAGYPPITVSPQKQKEKTQAALVAWLVEEAEKAAVYCTWEDLHWADPSTLEVLTLLLDQVPTTRLLTLLTFRPEFMPPWGSRSYFSQMTLSRLGRSQVEKMVAGVAGDKALPSEIVQQIVAKTDGVPLFVEELTKTVVETMREQVTGDGLQGQGIVGVQPAVSVPLIIPATLHDSLMARLDRLGAAKEIAQVGAVLGREFSYELLHVVSSVDEDTLQQGLKQLVEAELIYQRGLLPQAHYLFKHALVQDAAYQSLLKSTRQQYHQQIAQVLEEKFLETKETQPELLAHHYTEAGLIAQAIPYWQKAGQKAVERSANAEAISHLTKGLELLKTQPDTPEHAQHELMLQIALGGPLIATKGYAAPEVEKAYTRARKLCQQVGETPHLFPVLWGLCAFYRVRGRLGTARELGEQLLSLAQHVQNPALLMPAYSALGATLVQLGELTIARAHLEQGIVLCDPHLHRSPAFLYGSVDPGVFCLNWLAWALWFLGYPDQALQKSREALTLAREISHPFSLAATQYFVSVVHQFRREKQLAQERAEGARTISTEHDFPYWLWTGVILRGWALAEQRQEAEGIAQIRQGLAAFQATGAELWRSHHFALLADACGKAGQTDEGLTALAVAMAVVYENKERVYAAELYRLKGELTLQQANQKSKGKSQKSKVETSPQPLTPRPQAEEEAEGYFLKAIDIARKQQAKSLELRATMSLARLWQQQNKKAEAHKLLSDVYNWFTEGFDTKDLQEARALLET